MDWTNRKALVTGGGGFVGSHLCERLLSMGAHVRAMVHGDAQYRPGYLASLINADTPNLEVIGGDLRDAHFVRSAMEGIETVFHLGAITSVAYSYSHPEETLATNVMGTQNVCAAALEAKIRRMVHTSSAGVYGDALDGKPITEDHPVRGCNPYTAGKIGGDFVAQTYYMSYDLPVATIRLFNAYGPRMGRYLIIPTIIMQALQSDSVKLGDLSPTRNYTYVDDIVSGFVRMAEEDAAIGEVVHFGSTHVISMGELADTIFKAMGRDIKIVQDPSRMRPKKSEIYKVIADCSKAQNLLKWQPAVSLEEGLKRSIQWIQDGGYQNA